MRIAGREKVNGHVDRDIGLAERHSSHCRSAATATDERIVKSLGDQLATVPVRGPLVHRPHDVENVAGRGRGQRLPMRMAVRPGPAPPEVGHQMEKTNSRSTAPI